MKLKDAKIPTDTIEAKVREETHGDLIEIEIQCDRAEMVYLTMEDARKFGLHLVQLSEPMTSTHFKQVDLSGIADPSEAKSKLEKYNLQFNVGMSCTCKACMARRRLERVSTTKTDFGDISDRMIRCEFCNSNSCPHADDHNNSCTMTG